MVVLLAFSVVSEHPQFLGQFVIVRQNESTVSISSEVLRGIEAECAADSCTPNFLTLELCPVRLTSIFYHRKIQRVGNLFQRGNLGRVSVKVNGYDRLGLLSYLLSYE